MGKIKNKTVKKELEEILRKMRLSPTENAPVSGADTKEDWSAADPEPKDNSFEETVLPEEIIPPAEEPELPPAAAICLYESALCEKEPQPSRILPAVCPESGLSSLEEAVVLGDVIEAEFAEDTDHFKLIKFLPAVKKIVVCAAVIAFAFVSFRFIYSSGTSVSEARTAEVLALPPVHSTVQKAVDGMHKGQKGQPERNGVESKDLVPRTGDLFVNSQAELPETEPAQEEEIRLVHETVLTETDLSDIPVPPGEESEDSIAAMEREIQESVKRMNLAKQAVQEKEVSTLENYITAVRDGNSAVSPEEIRSIAENAVKYAKKYNLPLGLVVGVMQTESGFRPGAVSSADARGLMQVIWKYHYARLQKVGIKTKEELHDIEKGIHAGCIVLAGYMNEQKSITASLGRYYGALQQPYVSTVKSYWETYEMVRTGILDETEWRSAVEKTRTAWNKLFGKAPAKAAAPKPAAKTTVKEQAPKTVSAPVREPKKTGSTMVYRNSITVQKKDGTVKRWEE